MKKLKLNNLKLEVNDMLQREQLKTILGGGHDGYSPGGGGNCVESGDLCNGSSSNPSNLCCPELTCDVTGMNIGLCK